MCEGAAEEDPQSASKGQAMRLQYIQHPQDESADAAVHLNLAPSYVTYNLVAVQRVMDFFRTNEVSVSSQEEQTCCRNAWLVETVQEEQWSDEVLKLDLIAGSGLLGTWSASYSPSGAGTESSTGSAGGCHESQAQAVC